MELNGNDLYVSEMSLTETEMDRVESVVQNITPVGNPLLPTHNCFEILSNMNDSEETPSYVQQVEVTIPTPFSVSVPTLTPKIQPLKWEKALPNRLTATMGESSTSLRLKIEIKTMDTAEKKFVTALLDSGATSEFIDWDYAKS